MTQPEAKSKMPGATYGAKEKDCPPVKAAKEPKSHAANLEAWKDNHCQPLLELSTMRAILRQDQSVDHFLTGNRRMTALQILGLSTIDNKR